jgi:hypothetical protein
MAKDFGRMQCETPAESETAFAGRTVGDIVPTVSEATAVRKLEFCRGPDIALADAALQRPVPVEG